MVEPRLERRQNVVDLGKTELASIEQQVTGGLFVKRGDMVFSHGEGVYLFDTDGKRYLDFTSAQGVAMLGHAHSSVATAIAEQASRIISLPSFLYGATRSQFMGKLRDVLPPHLPHVFLCNSGTEAVEASLKFARLVTGRRQLVSATRSFHGRTTGSLALTWNPKSKEPFEPLLPDVATTQFNRPEALATDITQDTAALFLEVIQGEGGVNVATCEYLQTAQEVCKKHGALLVIDEIQTGFGRTGYWFAHQFAGLEPDLICMAKGLAAGFPIGAVAFTQEISSHMYMGVHGSTFGGNPLACAAGLAALTAYQEEGIIQHAARMGDYLMEEISRRLQGRRIVRAIRGRGLILGVELRTHANPFIRRLLQDHQILVLNAGSRILRLLPPLVVEESHVDKVLEALCTVLPD